MGTDHARERTSEPAKTSLVNTSDVPPCPFFFTYFTSGNYVFFFTSGPTPPPDRRCSSAEKLANY
jgi:hypothetical protein